MWAAFRILEVLINQIKRIMKKQMKESDKMYWKMVAVIYGTAAILFVIAQLI